MDNEHMGMEEQIVDEPARVFTAGESLSGLHRILHAPGGLFADVRDGLPWLPALIGLIVIGVAIALFNMPIAHEIRQFTQELLAERGLPARGEVGEAVYTPFAMLRTGFSSLAFVIVSCLLPALFYWLALLITFGNVPFGRIFTLRVFIAVIAQLSQLLNSIYLRLVPPEYDSFLSLSRSGLNTSLSFFHSGEAEGMSGMFTLFFLRGIDAFVVAQVILMIVGAAVVLDRGRKSVAGPIIVIALLGTAVTALSAALGAHFASGAFGG